MTSKAKKAAAKKGVVLVAKDPSLQPGKLKMIGGSASDDWNNTLACQTINTLWVKHSDEEMVDCQFKRPFRKELSGWDRRDSRGF